MEMVFDFHDPLLQGLTLQKTKIYSFKGSWEEDFPFPCVPRRVHHIHPGENGVETSEVHKGELEIMDLRLPVC